MSLEREGSWKTPPFPETRTINPLTTNTVPYVNNMTAQYGDFISNKLRKPSMSFAQYLQNNPYAPLTGQKDFDFALANLRNRPNVQGPTDTTGAYNAASAEAERNFNTRLLPGLLEKFGARGGRYGSDVARAGADAYGNVQANLQTQGARDKISAQEAYANRELSGSGMYSQQMQAIGQILNMMGGLENQNKQYAYSDFLKDQPETYLQGARSFLDTQPIFPQTILGPGSFYKEKPNIWDYMGRIQQHFGNEASIFGSVAGGAVGGASSRTLKEGERELSEAEIVRIANDMLTAPVRGWRYKHEMGMGNERIGPMLEDLPEEVRASNVTLDMMSMNGALLLTIQHLAARLEAVEDQLAVQVAQEVAI